jgi:hypothetical protein
MSGTLAWSDALWLARHRTPNDRLRFWGSAVSSAITAAVLCTAIGLLMIGGSTYVPVNVGVVADPGTRGGVALAVALVALPAIHLTGQAWRLGSVEQRQRFRQLRDAGAGPRELRRVAVAGACVPVFGGAVLGVLVWGRCWCSSRRIGARPGPRGLGGDRPRCARNSPFTEVPNVVTDTPWAPAVAVIAVTLAAGSSAARSASASRAAARRHGGRPLARVAAAAAAGSVTHPALLMALRRLGQEPRATARPALAARARRNRRRVIDLAVPSSSSSRSARGGPKSRIGSSPSHWCAWRPWSASALCALRAGRRPRRGNHQTQARGRGCGCRRCATVGPAPSRSCFRR